MSRVMPQRRHVVVTVCLEQADAFPDVDRSEGPGQRARDRAPRGQYPGCVAGSSLDRRLRMPTRCNR